MDSLFAYLWAICEHSLWGHVTFPEYKADGYHAAAVPLVAVVPHLDIHDEGACYVHLRYEVDSLYAVHSYKLE